MAGTITLDTYRGYVADLGVEDLSDAILTRALNTAQNQIAATRLWNFRLTDATITNGSATVSNLGVIVSASYTSDSATYGIPAIDKRQLQNGSDLTTTGDAPICYYIDTGSVIKGYPLATFTLRHYANPTEMSADGDFSIIPDEMQDALIYQAGGHAFARVGIMDMSQMYFQLAKDTLDSFDYLYNNDFVVNLPVQYPSEEA